MKITARSEKWVQGVLAACEQNTGRPLASWLSLARKAKVPDARGALRWGKAQGLSTVYSNLVAKSLFPEEENDAALLDGQYSGAKASLRRIYDALEKAARALGSDVEIMPRKSQVTFSRSKSFAVVRAAARDRVELALKLHGTRSSARLVAVPKATTSDPSHVVAVRELKDVNAELIRWMRTAYERAA